MKNILGAFTSLLFVVSSCMTTTAQQNILLNQTAYNLYILNPAAIEDYNLNGNCHYKKNWMGINNSPEHIVATLTGRSTNKNIGFGVTLGNEKAGIFSSSYMKGSFRYKLKLTENQNLSFGISGGFQKQITDFSAINAESPEEFSHWGQMQTSFIPDAALGIHYQFRKMRIHLASDQILNQKHVYKSSRENQLTYRKIPQFIFGFNHTFDIKPEYLQYSPNLILRSTKGLAIQFDVLNTFFINEKIIAGLGYRSTEALYFNLGYQLAERLRAVYSYEYGIRTQQYTRGGHEIGISFGVSDRNATSKIQTQNNTRGHKVNEKLFEKLDAQEQENETLNKRIDSANKNLERAVNELNELKKNQVTQEDIRESISAPTNTNSISHQYTVVDETSEKDNTQKQKSDPARYKIVFGVYKEFLYAKSYQKFLRRQLNEETHLMEIGIEKKKFLYVCSTVEYTDLNSAIVRLAQIKKNAEESAIKLTGGEAWILKTVNNTK